MPDRGDNIARAENNKNKKDMRPKEIDSTISVKRGLVMGGIRTNEEEKIIVGGQLKIQKENEINNFSK